jgi:hypothetical protein
MAASLMLKVMCLTYEMHYKFIGCCKFAMPQILRKFYENFIEDYSVTILLISCESIACKEQLLLHRRQAHAAKAGSQAARN